MAKNDFIFQSPHLGDMILGEYCLTEKLWDGIFSETWQAKDNHSEAVALQFIHNNLFIEAMRRHNLQIPALSNPAVAPLLGIHQDPPLLVWKYFAGCRLYTFIKELKHIKENVAVYIARRLLENIATITALGMIHGTLRSTRVLITPQKKVLITNFGIGYFEQRVVAQIFQIAQEREKFAQIMCYFPPEVLEDQVFDDPKSDVYAVGVLLAEMITGERTAAKKISDFVKNGLLKQELADIINKATADFNARYNHPQEMYEDLLHLGKASDREKTIHVAPPQSSKPITMEAIPADSEEYRVYRDQEKSAKQTIYADEVEAEPAEIEEAMPAEIGKKIQDIRLAEKTQEAQPVKVFPDNIKIPQCKPLTRKLIWPRLVGYYALASFFCFAVLAVLGWLLPQNGLSPFLYWPLAPLYSVQKAPAMLQLFGCITLILGGTMLLFLPLLDSAGSLLQNRLLRVILTIEIIAIFLGMLSSSTGISNQLEIFCTIVWEVGIWVLLGWILLRPTKSL